MVEVNNGSVDIEVQPVNPVRELHAGVLMWTKKVSDSKSVSIIYQRREEKKFSVREETTLSEGEPFFNGYREITDDEMVEFAIATEATFPGQERSQVLRTSVSQYLHGKLDATKGLIARLNSTNSPAGPQTE